MSSEVTPNTIRNSSDLLGDPEVVLRIFDHIDNRTTDLGDTVWTEPVANYTSQDRLDAELDLIKRRYRRQACHCSLCAQKMAQPKSSEMRADIAA